MTQLASDNFTRGNQSGWGLASDGTNTWSVIRGVSTFSIASNLGAVSGNSASYCVAQAGTGTSNDTDQTITFTRANTADVAGIVARVGDANNWYSCNIGEFTSNLVISKNVAGSYSDLAFGASSTYATTTTWSIRFQVIGTNLKGKIWDASGAEPGSWTVTTTDSSLTGGGYGILADPFTATAQNFSAYNATDGGGTTQSQSFTDANTVTETISAALQSSLADSATAADALSDSALSSITDALTVIDASTAMGMTTLPSDTVASTDFYSFLVKQTGTDVLTVAELLSMSGSTVLSDTSAATDSVIIAPPNVQAGIQIAWRMRNGAVSWKTRTGAITWRMRR